MKEIWRDKQAEVKAGKQTELCEFVFHYLHKRIGILSAVIEARAAHVGHIAELRSSATSCTARQSMPHLWACRSGLFNVVTHFSLLYKREKASVWQAGF